jgi:GTP-binding protein EngB required for normal cell division/uncharacterized protein (DUF697 family)
MYENEGLQDILEDIRKTEKELNEATIRCAIIGQSGAGKSSLINGIAGQRVAQVGVIETTMEPNHFRHGGMDFYDLPGCGTTNFPKEDYIDRFDLAKYDFVILVTANRVYENDIFLLSELKKKKVPVFLVRSKIDATIENERFDNGKSEENTLNDVRSYLISQFNGVLNKVYLISSRYPQKWDFDNLLQDIAGSQKGIKHDRFVTDAVALSKRALDAKKVVAGKIVMWSAIGSAANAINPIPGLDISIDLSILVTMCSKINRVFGISEEHLKYLKENQGLSEDPRFIAAVQLATRHIANFATKEGIIYAIKRFSNRIVAKTVVKYIPFVGQVVSAAAGYTLTNKFGQWFLEDACKIADDILDSFLEKSATEHAQTDS